MGLDSVELLMYIEELFGVTISDTEAEKMRTPNDIADVVVQKIVLNQSDRCKSQIVFYVLRDYVETNFGYPKKDFTPQTIIGDFLPEKSRKEFWNVMSLTLGLELPSLSADDLQHETNVLHKLRDKVFSEISVTDKTVRKLVEWIMSLNYEKLIRFENIYSKFEVRDIIRGAISEHQLNDVKEITGTSSITEDLGID